MIIMLTYKVMLNQRKGYLGHSQVAQEGLKIKRCVGTRIEPFHEVASRRDSMRWIGVDEINERHVALRVVDANLLGDHP